MQATIQDQIRHTLRNLGFAPHHAGYKLLIAAIKETVPHGKYHLERDLIMEGYNKGALTVNVYPFDGVALYNDSVEEYFHNTLALIDKDVRHDLFHGNHPVFTRVRDRVPSYYGENCEIENCLVADGCMLGGEVEDSLLFRNVTVYPGAEVENCVIMNDTVIGEGAQLRYVILDKDVVVRPGAKLMGTPTTPVIITRGEVV